jgi:anti-anti-sigma factor
MLTQQSERSGLVVERRQISNQDVFFVSGRMDAESTPQFEQNCREWIAEGRTLLIVDLGGLAYVSSMGLRSFLSIAKTLQGKGGALRICRLTGLVKQVFEITGLTKTLPIYESAEAAVAGS